MMKYSEETDRERMLKNIQDHGAEIPEMVLLMKDHKSWSEDSGEVIPSRPVVSGRVGLNSHLSEILSEILEPVSLNMKSTEVSSTEEALHKITKLNQYIKEGKNIKDLNVLGDFNQDNEVVDLLTNLLQENNSRGIKGAGRESVVDAMTKGIGEESSNGVDTNFKNLHLFQTFPHQQETRSGANTGESTAPV